MREDEEGFAVLRIGGDIEDGELALADFEVMGYVFNGVFIREFADAQERAAAVGVADIAAAFGVHGGSRETWTIVRGSVRTPANFSDRQAWHHSG